jgi:hypothetical protein
LTHFYNFFMVLLREMGWNYVQNSVTFFKII